MSAVAGSCTFLHFTGSERVPRSLPCEWHARMKSRCCKSIGVIRVECYRDFHTENSVFFSWYCMRVENIAMRLPTVWAKLRAFSMTINACRRYARYRTPGHLTFSCRLSLVSHFSRSLIETHRLFSPTFASFVLMRMNGESKCWTNVTYK